MSDMKESCRFDEYNNVSEEPITGSNMTEVDSLYFAELSYIRFEDIDKLEEDSDEIQESVDEIRAITDGIQDRYGSQSDPLGGPAHIVRQNDELEKVIEEKGGTKGWVYDGMPLSEYAELALAVETDPSKVAMLETLATDPRYEKCTISLCESEFCPGGNHDEHSDCESEGVQWAAITVSFNDPENTSVISFRGTDSTEIGWAEDFEMAFEDETDAQRLSAEYLADYAENNPNTQIILTGHSKGGNDAIYAYLASEKTVREQVKHVYNFDGPGVSEKVAAHYAQAYGELGGKMDSYLPQDSVIGLLLKDHPGKVHFVESDGISSQTDPGIFAEHDAFSWKITENGNFKEVEQSDISKFINEVLDEALVCLSDEDKEVFVKALGNLGLYAILGGEEDIGVIASRLVVGIANLKLLSPEGKIRLLKTIATLAVAFGWNAGEVAADIVVDKAGELWEDAKEKAGELWEAAKDKAEELYDKVTLAADAAKKKVSEFYTQAAKAAQNAAKGILAFSQQLMDAIDVVKKDFIAYVKNNTFSKGSSKSYSTDNLNVSVTVLRQVVTNLESAQRKIYNLDWKLDSLRSKLYAWEVCDQAKVAEMDYTMTGSNIVQNLAEHSLNEGYDWELSACIRYLNTVITKLEQNEDGLVAKAKTV